MRNFGGVYIVSSEPCDCGEVINLINECAWSEKGASFCVMLIRVGP